jgi:hypothetical protein
VEPAGAPGLARESHSNINLQMNYWPAEPTNLPECHRPLFDLLGELAVSGARTARTLDGLRLPDVLSRLRGPAVGPDGRLLEWSRPYPEREPGHRHLLHLYGAYPGEEVDPDETPELAAAVRRSLVARLAAGGGGTGWSQAWALCLWARLADGAAAGAAAGAAVRGFLRRFAAANLLGLHPPEIRCWWTWRGWRGDRSTRCLPPRPIAPCGWCCAPVRRQRWTSEHPLITLPAGAHPRVSNCRSEPPRG